MRKAPATQQAPPLSLPGFYAPGPTYEGIEVWEMKLFTKEAMVCFTWEGRYVNKYQVHVLSISNKTGQVRRGHITQHALDVLSLNHNYSHPGVRTSAIFILHAFCIFPGGKMSKPCLFSENAPATPYTPRGVFLCFQKQQHTPGAISGNISRYYFPYTRTVLINMGVHISSGLNISSNNSHTVRDTTAGCVV